MPVADHPIHESVRKTSDYRYGCHNRPHQFRQICHGADCYGLQVWPFVMSNDCKYKASDTDMFCNGCHHAVAKSASP